MFKALFDVTKQLLGLSKDTQDNKDDIKAMQTRLDNINDILKQVIFELQRLKENEAHEREKMALRLDNVLLRSDRILPPGKTEEQTKFAELEEQILFLQMEVETLKKRIAQIER